MTPSSKEKLKAFPVAFVTEGKIILIIGNGQDVPSRIASARRFAWQEILVVSPELTEEAISELSEDSRCLWIRRDVMETDIDTADLIVEDTENREQAQQVADWCQSRNKLLNSVDKIDLCNIFYMSLIFRDPLVLSITSQGDAPALSVALRKWLETNLSTGWEHASKGMADIRKNMAGGQPRRVLLKKMAACPYFNKAILENQTDKINRCLNNALRSISDTTES